MVIITRVCLAVLNVQGPYVEGKRVEGKYCELHDCHGECLISVESLAHLRGLLAPVDELVELMGLPSKRCDNFDGIECL